MRKLSPAPDRTVDMFSGKTREQETEEAERIQAGLDVAAEAKEKGLTIEQAADKYRANAFTLAEFTSGAFGDEAAAESQYRVTRKNGWLYLERTGVARGGVGAYSYAGLMFPEGELEKLARVFVAAVRDMRGDKH